MGRFPEKRDTGYNALIQRILIPCAGRYTGNWDMLYRYLPNKLIYQRNWLYLWPGAMPPRLAASSLTVTSW